MKKPALFLDRDGVINLDHGYVHTSENFEFIDGIFDVVVAANRRGYIVVVVTNQAGIGRGYYSEEQFHMLTDWMKLKFNDYGGEIHAVYYCPHHPDHAGYKYRIHCTCRKPLPGMILAARDDFDLDLRKSILVGDKQTDMDAGISAGVEKLLLFGGNSKNKKVINISQVIDVINFLN
jgi:D-glycero-D-manno-heptose 1,7-bisphosphate phosphatase